MRCYRLLTEIDISQMLPGGTGKTEDIGSESKIDT